MTVYEFISKLQEALDRATTESTPNRQVITTFIAPNSGFCGPTIRPKFLGYTDETKLTKLGVPAEGRYGMTRMQVERVLEAFNVTLPPESEFA
jgi:hypothetical protein